jgi:2,3-dihydroxybiphenyl 1,2-dioxygenase
VINALAYIGFRSPAFEQWLDFGPEVLGLEIAGRGEDGSVRLRVDDAAHRISVHPGERNDLAYLGWSVPGPAQLESLVRWLGEHDYDVQEGDAATCADRGVMALCAFDDRSGLRHEIAWGLRTRPSSFRAGRALSGFVTGDGGLGHVVLLVPDAAQAERFYTDVLGFRLSDRIEGDGMSLRFLHCNPRHHTVALAQVPGMVGLHHLMLEVRSLDDVGNTLDLCRRRGVPVATELGRHSNDLMTSFYLRTPSGFEIEYGWGGRTIDDDSAWEVASYASGSIWGHARGQGAGPPGVLRPAPGRD